MNKQWKRVPFDIELAKKIQSGEVEGRFVTREGNSVRIICTNFKENGYEKIIFLRETITNDEQIHICKTDGKYYEDLPNKKSNLDLVIELPEETPKQEVRAYSKEEAAAYKTGCEWGIEACKKAYKYMAKKEIPKHEFKPFDKVLVRDNNEGKWVPDIFRYYDDNYLKDYPYRCCADDYKYCIPFEGNEHLVGTTNNPE